MRRAPRALGSAVPRRARRARGERGAVTAETAMALPLLVAVTIGLVWLLAVGAAQVRVVDAARETARSAARGDDTAPGVAAGRRVAPPGAEVALSAGAGEVRATATASVTGPGGIFGFLPAVEVHAEAVTTPEEG